VGKWRYKFPVQHPLFGKCRQLVSAPDRVNASLALPECAGDSAARRYALLGVAFGAAFER